MSHKCNIEFGAAKRDIVHTKLWQPHIRNRCPEFLESKHLEHGSSRGE